jgi:hypothetical protein
MRFGPAKLRTRARTENRLLSRSRAAHLAMIPLATLAILIPIFALEVAWRTHDYASFGAKTGREPTFAPTGIGLVLFQSCQRGLP